MQIYTKKTGLKHILFIVPETEYESGELVTFCRLQQQLVATMKHDPAYQYRHLEIRKEQR